MEEHPETPSAKRRRASRAGQPKRFECHHPGCGKRYSRAEHLHRHELNHNPKEVYRCEEPQCGHSFVRADLFARHKARHDELGAGTPLESHASNDSGAPFQETPAPESTTTNTFSTSSQQTSAEPQHSRSVSAPSINTDFANWNAATRPPLLTPDSTLVPQSVEPSSELVSLPSQPIGSPTATRTANTWTSTDGISAQANDNFAAWLFESPGSQYDDFNLANMPFMDFGLEYSPKDIWNLEEFAATTEPSAGAESHASPSDHADQTSRVVQSITSVSEQRQSDVANLFSHFLKKQRNQRSLATQDQSSLLYSPDSHTFPNLSSGMLEKFIASYWANVDKSLSIVHQPTFSPNSCNVLLLMAIVMLGAADLVRTKPKGYLGDYQEFADIIATQLRWEIFTDGDAQPPVQLWVAQALLLLEYYEKQWSSRKLHERAHIHHASTLTLLRRGSPLVGKSESESPVSGIATRCASPTIGEEALKPKTALDSWWNHWVRNESFNRVVFAAFQMDTLHAIMYGHAADMAPYEIRLALPCDDSLWTAKSAEEVHRLDANLKMYGIRPINFLDGLKRCLHAHDVQTHAPARMLLMAGLLSVGWHISRREKHLQFLETVPSRREQGRWRSLLLHAFGHWRHSFDEAVGTRKNNGQNAKHSDTSAPTVLFHLAHMTMHADIIDIQIFSGTKRLLGRKVSEKDYLNVVRRMKSWACTPVARHAVLHAFKLLHEVLINNPRKVNPNQPQTSPPSITYSCRHDSIIYRPWSIYLASLIMWAYQRASSLHISGTYNQHNLIEGQDEREFCCRYLSTCAAIEDPARLLPLLSAPGCAAVLSIVAQDFSNGEPELMLEATRRLQNCRDMLITNISSRIPG